MKINFCCFVVPYNALKSNFIAFYAIINEVIVTILVGQMKLENVLKQSESKSQIGDIYA